VLPTGVILVLSANEISAMAEVLTRPTSTKRARILVSDDQHDILMALSLLLKMNNFSAETADSPERALEAARTGNFDLILMDLNYSRDTTSGKEGLDLLSALRSSGVAVPVIVMTAWGNFELAVEAMRLGAVDFVQKPWDNQRLLSTLNNHLDRAQSARQQELRVRSELEIARHVQQKLLPQQFKPLSSLDYSAVCIPAREVGGDYYDFFDLGPDRLAGLLADVSGKGVAAAMLMANLQACFRTQFDGHFRDAGTLLETVNRLFHASTPIEQYVTLFYFEYENKGRMMRYVNCGHLAPVLFRANGTAERLNSTSTVLGLFPHCTCECQELTLQERDVVAIFTDGVTDFLDQSGNEFGEERFLSLVQSVRALGAQAAVRHLAERLRSASGGADQFDDQTIVLLKAR
jgi:sigma-B regulation protein RsbU (phosphoserine phosphatase)